MAKLPKTNFAAAYRGRSAVAVVAAMDAAAETTVNRIARNAPRWPVDPTGYGHAHLRSGSHLSATLGVRSSATMGLIKIDWPSSG